MEKVIPGARRRLFTYPLSYKQKRYIRFFGIILVAVVILYTLLSLVANKKENQALSISASQEAQKIQLSQPVATQTINRTFAFPVLDKSGNKPITTFQYKIDTAELRNEVVINGSKYHPIKGKTFLILTLDITNNYTQDLQIQPRDYVRVTVNNSSEKLAPDLYNQSVDVQAISTMHTDLGLAIDTNARNIKLLVGQITGSKETIPLTLSYQ